MRTLGLNRAEILVADPDAAQATFTRLFNGAHFTPEAGVHNRPLECRHDWQHGLELVCPRNPDDSVGRKLREFGEGHVLTVVFQVEDLVAAKAHLLANGSEIQYEGDYDRHPDVELYRQLVIRPEGTHGFFMTLMQRRWKPGALRAVAPADPAGMTVLPINRVRVFAPDPDAARETFTRLFANAAFAPTPLGWADEAIGLELVGPGGLEGAGRPAPGAVLAVVYDVDDPERARDYLRRQGFALARAADPREVAVEPAAAHNMPVVFRQAGAARPPRLHLGA